VRAQRSAAVVYLFFCFATSEFTANFFERRTKDSHRDSGSDTIHSRRKKAVNKFASTTAIVAVFMLSGAALSGQANAQDQQQSHRTHHYQDEASNAPLGDGGGHWAGKCWVATNGNSNSLYQGYWGECPKPGKH
jgi:hypothetical protein